MKYLFIISLCTISSSVLAGTIDANFNNPRNPIKAGINNEDGIARFMKEGHEIESFSNLIINEPSISSTIVPTTSNGVAIIVSTTGSRTKYDAIIPIYFNGNSFYVDCAYKSSYDSVDGIASSGTSCQHALLKDLDIPGVINEDQMQSYQDGTPQELRLKIHDCTSPQSRLNGEIYEVNCGSDPSTISSGKTMIFNKNGDLVFTTNNYNFVYQGNGEFVLYAETNKKAAIIHGNFGCINSSPVKGSSEKPATLGAGTNIHYSIQQQGQCYNGSYYYDRYHSPIALSGIEKNGSIELIELGEGRQITGSFTLTRLEPEISGTWAPVAPQEQTLPVR